MRWAYSISPEGGSQPHPAGTVHANPLGPQNPLSTTVAHTSPQVAILSPLHCPWCHRKRTTRDSGDVEMVKKRQRWVPWSPQIDHIRPTG